MTRLLAATAAISAWMVVLSLGWAPAGVAHLLLLAGLLLFPWRALGPGDPAPGDEDAPPPSRASGPS